MLLSQYSPSRRQEVFSLSQPGIVKSNRYRHVCAENVPIKIFGERDVFNTISHSCVSIK